MLKILYKNKTEEELEGKIKFYQGDQPATCNYNFIINGKNGSEVENLKLVYDDKTDEGVCFSYYSYYFYDGYEKYQELYKQSIRELKLEKKFNKLIEEYGEHISLEDLSDWLVFNEDKIKDIYKENE